MNVIHSYAGEMMRNCFGSWFSLDQILVVTTLAVLPMMANANHPELIGTWPNGDRIFLESVSSGFPVRNVLTRTVYGVPVEFEGVRGVLSQRTEQQINCSRRTLSLIQISGFSDAAAESVPLIQLNSAQLSTTPLSLAEADVGSPAYQVWHRVCGPSRKGDEEVPSSPVHAAQSTDPAESDSAPAGNGPSTTVPREKPRAPEYTGTNNPAPASNDRYAPISDTRPFSDSRFSLGQLAGLANNAYIDRQIIETSRAALERFEIIRNDFRPEGMEKALLAGAYQRQSETLSMLEQRFRDKQALLQQLDLHPATPDNISAYLGQISNQWILRGFRAEIYQTGDARDYVIVFRGTTTAGDWANNLWVGVDLAQIESPSYQTAEKVVTMFMAAHPKARPLVVGHSLGGGLAQYVGNKFGLRTVAFNSAPLPARYITLARHRNPDNIKVFTSVYRSMLSENFVPDPVSISVPKVFTANAFKSRAHIVKPVCILSQPNPPLSNEEDIAYANDIAGIVFSPAILSGIQIGETIAIHQLWTRAANALMSHPVWQNRHPDLNAEIIATNAQHALKKEVGQHTQVEAGLSGAGHVLFDAFTGRTGKALKTLAIKSAFATVKINLRQHYMAHLMDRFVRGMTEVSNADALSFQGHKGNAAWEAQCDGVSYPESSQPG